MNAKDLDNLNYDARKLSSILKSKRACSGKVYKSEDKRLVTMDDEEAQSLFNQKETITRILCAHVIGLQPSMISQIYGNSVDFIESVINNYESKRNAKKEVMQRIDAQIEQKLQERKHQLRVDYQNGVTEREMMRKYGISCRQLYQWLDLNSKFVVPGFEWRPEKKIDSIKGDVNKKIDDMAKAIARGLNVRQAAIEAGVSKNNAYTFCERHNVIDKAEYYRQIDMAKGVQVVMK